MGLRGPAPAMKGPAPIPSDIKRLTGKPGRVRPHENEPRPAGLAEPPDCISAEALDVWNEVRACMPPSLYTGADTFVLHAFCESVALHRRATRELAGADLVLGSECAPRLNPLIRAQAEAARTIAGIGSRLGLSPSDRSRLSCHQPNADPGTWRAFLASSRSSKG